MVGPDLTDILPSEPGDTYRVDFQGLVIGLVLGEKHRESFQEASLGLEGTAYCWLLGKDTGSLEDLKWNLAQLIVVQEHTDRVSWLWEDLPVLQVVEAASGSVRMDYCDQD